MKKINLKGCFCGFAAGIAVMSAIPVAAKNSQEKINVVFRNIKICVDGQEVNTAGAEPFIYNGTTYLPIKKVGEAFGKAATWNGYTNSVYLGSQPGNESCIFDIMQPYASDGYRQYYGDETFKAAGAERKNGFELYRKGHVTFNLDGKYNGLSFECIVENSGDYPIRIYADDRLVQEINAPNTDSPKKISIPLNGVNQLKICDSMNSYTQCTKLWNVKLY